MFLCRYIGLLFSTVKSPTYLNDGEWELAEDIENDDYVFTDGCGTAPTFFMKRVMKEMDLPKYSADMDVNDVVSAIQIRFKGCKGQ